MWEVVRDLKGAAREGAKDPIDAVSRISGLDRGKVRLAADYYAAYRDSVEERIRLDEEAAERLRRALGVASVKVLLDEMWTPTIAVELRKGDFDVVAISERSHAERYAGIPDDEVFARAQDDGRAIVTDTSQTMSGQDATGKAVVMVITVLSTHSTRRSTATTATPSSARW